MPVPGRGAQCLAHQLLAGHHRWRELATRATVAVAGEVVPQHHALPSQYLSKALVKVEFRGQLLQGLPIAGHVAQCPLGQVLQMAQP